MWCCFWPPERWAFRDYVARQTATKQFDTQAYAHAWALYAAIAVPSWADTFAMARFARRCVERHDLARSRGARSTVLASE